jgi:AbrB family looped-hinge helix DNA binding protein
MPKATVTSKGQTTIPKEVRDYLKVQPGDRLDFVIEKDGRVVVRPANLDVRELKGLLHRPGMKPVTVEQMNSAVRKRFQGRVR